MVRTKLDDVENERIERIGDLGEDVVDSRTSRRPLNSGDLNDEDTLLEDERVQEDPTPLPWKKVIVISCVTYTNAFCLSVIFPMLPFITHDFFPNLSATQLGIYSGFLGGAFSGGSFFGNILWGRIADTYGRRPALMFGVFGTIVTIICFGFSISFIWAVGFRFLWGALNGNIAVAKTYLSEVCDDSNLAKGFSMLGSAAAIGRLTGPIAAGFFSCPALKFDLLNIAIFRNFPYILPCLICACLCICTLIGSFLYLEETLQKVSKEETTTDEDCFDKKTTDLPGYDHLAGTDDSAINNAHGGIYSINSPCDDVIVSEPTGWLCCGICLCRRKTYHRLERKKKKVPTATLR